MVFFYGGSCGEYGDGVISRLKELGVEIVVLTYSYKPPIGFSRTFGNQMFIFDILDWISVSSSDFESWCVLDSDCLILGDLSGMWSDVGKYGVLTYDLGLPVGEGINGIDQNDLTMICVQEGWGGGTGLAHYFGGEYFCATAVAIKAGKALYRNVLEKSYSRWSSSLVHCTEEAHMLSCWYRSSGFPVGTANSYIKRMWTGFRYNNRQPGDYERPIWHLPAEKRTGISYLFKYLKTCGSLDGLTISDFKASVARYVGVPKRGIIKGVKDFWVKINEKI
ncbi:MAG: hypothetical protein JF609_05370 [Verrucomicrobia bacterium]|nr:hypothetical protein [Verrucomicrobiota bacterium]